MKNRISAPASALGCAFFALLAPVALLAQQEVSDTPQAIDANDEALSDQQSPDDVDLETTQNADNVELETTQNADDVELETTQNADNIELETPQNDDNIELQTISIDKTPSSGDADYEIEDDLDELNDSNLGPPPDARQSNLEELRRSFQSYKESLAAGSYDEADLLAKRMVELAIRLYGLDSNESAKALTNLGLVQQKNQEYDAAILNFTSAIDIIERIEDRLNSSLINPIRGLAAAQLGSGRPDLARASYDRAVHVSHVNEGPHNLMQIEILEELAETHLSMDDRDSALDIHQFIYNIEARNAEIDREKMIPALRRQAEWMNRMRLYEKERSTWRRMISLLEDTRGKKDLSLVEPLTGLGRSYLFYSELESEFYTEASMSSGDTYMKRAARIAMRSPDATWRDKFNALIAMGDFYTLSSRTTKAVNTYEDAWVMITEDENDVERMAARDETLGQLHVLQDIHPPKYFQDRRNKKVAPIEGEEFLTGSVVAGYRVTSRGTTRDINIIYANPQGLADMEYAFSREMNRLVHRPRLVKGEVVETPDQSYTHTFLYRASDLPDAEQKEEEEKNDDTVDETVAVEEP
jgi:tetratricopeptide (TPR) repeat protein